MSWKSGFSVPGEDTETVIGISIARPRRFFLLFCFFSAESERSDATVGKPWSEERVLSSDSSNAAADSEAEVFFAPSLTSLPQLHLAFLPANSGFRLRNTLPHSGQDTLSFKRNSD